MYSCCSACWELPRQISDILEYEIVCSDIWRNIVELTFLSRFKVIQGNLCDSANCLLEKMSFFILFVFPFFHQHCKIPLSHIEKF